MNNETLEEPKDIFGQLGRSLGRALYGRAKKVSLSNAQSSLEVN